VEAPRRATAHADAGRADADGDGSIGPRRGHRAVGDRDRSFPISVRLRSGALVPATTVASALPDAPCRGDPARPRALLQVFLV
jgi:hypothetical protein